MSDQPQGTVAALTVAHAPDERLVLLDGPRQRRAVGPHHRSSQPLLDALSRVVGDAEGPRDRGR